MDIEELINTLNIGTFIFYIGVLFFRGTYKNVISYCIDPVSFIKFFGYVSRCVVAVGILEYVWINIEMLNIYRIIIISIGMYLNLSVYYLLGANGVYYGREMGLSLPYVNKFPLSHISHSQYLGVIMIYLGLYNILPISSIMIAVYGYLIMSQLESVLCD